MPEEGIPGDHRLGLLKVGGRYSGGGQHRFEKCAKILDAEDGKRDRDNDGGRHTGPNHCAPVSRCDQCYGNHDAQLGLQGKQRDHYASAQRIVAKQLGQTDQKGARPQQSGISGDQDKHDRWSDEGQMDDVWRERLLHIADQCPEHRTLESEVVVTTKLEHRGR